jgi:hypothetical protein
VRIKTMTPLESLSLRIGTGPSLTITQDQVLEKS